MFSNHILLVAAPVLLFFLLPSLNFIKLNSMEAHSMDASGLLYKPNPSKIGLCNVIPDLSRSALYGIFKSHLLHPFNSIGSNSLNTFLEMALSK